MQYSEKEIHSKADYFDAYDNEYKVRRALDKAQDIRKFEIDLYWKRATYFWAFIASSFAGYFAVVVMVKSRESSLERLFVLLIISSIGLIFSYGWFLANKGSKYWQENWEKHVDMLEDDVVDPLYKTTINNNPDNKFSLLEPYQFSVSKINQILSFSIFCVWYLLHIGSTYNLFNSIKPTDLLLFVSSVALNIGVVSLLWSLPNMTASGKKLYRSNNSIWFSRRMIAVAEETPNENLSTRPQAPSRLPNILVKIVIYSLLFIAFCLVFYLDLIDLDNAKNLLFLVSIFALRECVINMLIEGKNAHTIFVDIDKAGTLDHFKFIFTAIIASFCGKIGFLKIIPSADNIITSGKLTYNIFDEKLHDQVTRLTTGFDPYQHERNIAAAKAAVWGKVSVSAAMLAFVTGLLNSIPERYLGMVIMKFTDILHFFNFWN